MPHLRSGLLAWLCATCVATGGGPARGGSPVARPEIAIDAAQASRLQTMMKRWQYHLTDSGLARACLTENGEELAWLMSPPLLGYYWGYRATKDQRWIDAAVACADAWIRRGVTEPDGFVGWPKLGASGNPVDALDSYVADSLVGEAAVLRPIVLISKLIVDDPALKRRYGEAADRYLKLATTLYRKWEQRGTWRTVENGTVAVILPYGIDPTRHAWTGSYDRRSDQHIGFTLQDNKQNLVASWLLAMSEATGDDSYRRHAAQWFAVMKSRMEHEPDGTYKIWNYWQPAGPWDYREDGQPKHWIGVHPKAGYYDIDTSAIVLSYEAGLVFDRADVAALARTAMATGRFWPALAGYDPAVTRTVYEGLDPVGWADITLLPWFVAATREGVGPKP